MKNNYLIVLLALLVGLSSLIAEETLTIDLDTAMSMAKANNIDLKRATLKLQGERYERNAAFNAFVPTLQGTSALLRSNEEPSQITGMKQTNLYVGYEANFAFSPALFDGVAALKRKYELGQITYEQAVLEIENGVKEYFYNIIVLNEQIKLLEDNLKTIQARYDLTKLNFEAGQVSELELLQTQVSLENFKPDLNNAKNSYSTTLLNFKTLLGIDLNQEITIDGEINPEVVELTVDEAYKLALQNSLDLRGVDKSIELLKAQKRGVWGRNFIPIVNLGYSFNRGLSDPFGDDRFKEENFGDDTGKFSVSLIYSFDALFPGSSQRREVNSLKRSIEDTTYQKSALLDGLKLQVTNYINSLNNSLGMQDALTLTVDLAFKTLGKVEVAYKAGTAELLEVENAENDYNKARLELLREKFNYTMTSIKLNSLISAQ